MPAVDQFGQPVPHDRTYRFGRIISQVFHPTINGLVAYLVVGAAAPGMSSSYTGLAWAGICILTIIIPPAIYFYLRLFHGDFSDDDVSHRTERTGLYIVALLTVLIGSIVLYIAGIPRAFLRLNAAAVGVTLVCMMINFRWKISVHSASIATLATVATLYFPWLGGVLWLCALLVGWARIKTGNHTPLQVLAGWSVAVVGVLLAIKVGA